MLTGLPVHCGLTRFQLLPALRLRKRLPALSSVRIRLPSDTEAASGRRPGGSAATELMLADAVSTNGALDVTSTVCVTAPTLRTGCSMASSLGFKSIDC